MNEQEKRDYLERYSDAKKIGVPFFPDVLFKDAVVSLLIFIVLIALAYFLGAPLEDRANPADTTYTPRPEWYFLFLFQMLKYFPGNLEVIGVFVIPTLAILVLIALPFLDRSARRHPRTRLAVVGLTAVVVIGVTLLTMQAIRESPPPAEASGGDPTALIYTKNCSACHGPSITVPPGTNLHNVIAQGRHEGMPAWSADLTSDEIDSLAGFILSPGGSELFNKNCGACHQVSELVAGNPLELKKALDEGLNYPAHKGKEIPDWSKTLSTDEVTKLLNFMVAPDGQRLYEINCSPCHGSSVTFSGNEDELRTIIAKGGLHLEMPSWKEKLSDSDLNILAQYVASPSANPEGEDLFQKNCSECHGKRVPQIADIAQARQAIAGGGAHKTMPVWGNILTAEQMDALVNYTLDASQGTPREVGQKLYGQYCSVCHGLFGEGGVNPTRPNDIIAPISSAEFLKTRDNFTIKSIVTQGQPDFGMSPFGTANGGPLEDADIEAIIAYVRSWEANPPVAQPPEIPVSPVSLEGAQIYAQVCAQCHGTKGEGKIGPALSDSKFQKENSDQKIFDSINLGHPVTPMIGWGEILSSTQIQQLVKFIRTFSTEKEPVSPGSLTFTANIEPIFKEKCAVCHGTMGGWDSSTYESIMSTGDHGPAIKPGDVENSLLAQLILGIDKEGTIMPPGGKLPDEEIQVIIDWIAGGALK